MPNCGGYDAVRIAWREPSAITLEACPYSDDPECPPPTTVNAPCGQASLAMALSVTSPSLGIGQAPTHYNSTQCCGGAPNTEFCCPASCCKRGPNPVVGASPVGTAPGRTQRFGNARPGLASMRPDANRLPQRPIVQTQPACAESAAPRLPAHLTAGELIADVRALAVAVAAGVSGERCAVNSYYTQPLYPTVSVRGQRVVQCGAPTGTACGPSTEGCAGIAATLGYPEDAHAQTVLRGVAGDDIFLQEGCGGPCAEGLVRLLAQPNPPRRAPRQHA